MQQGGTNLLMRRYGGRLGLARDLVFSFLQGVTAWRTLQPILRFEMKRVGSKRNLHGCRRNPRISSSNSPILRLISPLVSQPGCGWDTHTQVSNPQGEGVFNPEAYLMNTGGIQIGGLVSRPTSIGEIDM